METVPPEFDPRRLDKSLYDVSSVHGIGQVQTLAEDFLVHIRAESAAADRQNVSKFFAIITDPAAWHHVQNVVPELRKAYFDSDLAEIRGPLGSLLRECFRRSLLKKRQETTLSKEMQILRKAYEDTVGYIEFAGKEGEHVPKELQSRSIDLARRVENILEKGEVLLADTEELKAIAYRNELVFFKYRGVYFEVPIVGEEVFKRALKGGDAVIVRRPEGRQLEIRTNEQGNRRLVQPGSQADGVTREEGLTPTVGSEMT